MGIVKNSRQQAAGSEPGTATSDEVGFRCRCRISLSE